jgi:paraquat-inducible protein A
MSESLAACAECDALHRRRALARGEKARCIRCGAVLYRRPYLRAEQLLPVVIAALVTFVIANSFPIIDLQIQGQRSGASLFGSILALWGEGRRLIAALVFATTLLFPLIDLLAMLVLLLPSRHGRRASLWRFVQALRPWGMIEVFMLGVLVSLVKLSHLAHVLPGVALWAFAVLTVLMAVILSFDPRSLWENPEGPAS